MDSLEYLKSQRLKQALYTIDLKYKKIIEEWSLFKKKQRDIQKATRRVESWYKSALQNEKRKLKGKAPIKKIKRINYESLYDTIYSLYTVLKWSYRAWHIIENVCISCGTPIEVGHLEDNVFVRNPNCQNWHFVSRAKSKALVYYDNNTRCQCWYCNGHLKANLWLYRKNLVNKIWEEEVDCMERKDLVWLCTPDLPNKYSELFIPLIKDIRDKVFVRLSKEFNQNIDLGEKYKKIIKL